ncbi:MAG: insulinase family protein [Leptolyngbyaceae cyanobacterium MAG.088]|nr:insulinase family protein [Leptolyngbyaceae cyanobacterium MAG.088]
MRKQNAIARIVALVLIGIVLIAEPAWAKETLPSAPPTQSIQPYLKRFSKEITEFTLKNGLKFIVLERHQSPVIAFHTYADVGGVDEPDGQTGVAHYLEHLAFKGTQRIGTTDYESEKPLLEKLDQLFDQIQAAKTEGDTQTATQLQAEFDEVAKQAASYVKQNEMGQLVNQFGGVGLNATTSSDATRYFYSLPSNKLELWMSTESERFLEPVFREFYKEKDVILEERRQRTDNSPIGQMVEAFLDTAFTTHPYRRPVIGYEKDLRALTRKNVQDFFDTHYGPNNLTIAIVGDVEPKQVKRLAKAYFGRFPAKAKPPRVTAVEPPQTEPRSVTRYLETQPWYLEGFHRPDINDPDYAVYDMIGSILSDGRTSRLYKSLVDTQQIALSAQGGGSFPNDKYPNLMLFYALTAPGHTADEVGAALNQEIMRLKTEPVSVEELDRVKTQARAGLLRSLRSNGGMARLLTSYEVKTGSWRNLFKELDKIAAVTPDDIQRVAQATFKPENRTVGRLLPTAEKPNAQEPDTQKPGAQKLEMQPST